MHPAGLACLLLTSAAVAQDVTLRFATFNVHDMRRADVAESGHARMNDLASVIGAMRPNIILLNEVTSTTGVEEPPADSASSVAAAFAATYLRPIKELPHYRVWVPPTNTGSPSGFDLDRNGTIESTPGSEETPEKEATAAGVAFGNDCYGFGTFPGQYGMALLIDDRLEFDPSTIRTFQRYPWSYLQGAFLPTKGDGTPWFTPEELKYVRLSSKTFADVPVKLPNGAVVHVLCSHPTPPAFDGPEQRNHKRNHDEIRLIGEYIDDAPFLVDDHDREGGLGRFDSFVVLGDLNADPAKGSSFKDPIRRHLAGNRRVNFSFEPRSDVAVPGLDASDTASFKLRVDYVLPSKDLKIKGGEVWRHVPEGASTFPSDHYPVYLDLIVPSPPPDSGVR